MGNQWGGERQMSSRARALFVLVVALVMLAITIVAARNHRVQRNRGPASIVSPSPTRTPVHR